MTFDVYNDTFGVGSPVLVFYADALYDATVCGVEGARYIHSHKSRRHAHSARS